MIIYIMGVAGCGKSTVGETLALKLDCPYEEADKHHSEKNRLKMRSGVALTDQDRLPWLETLNEIAIGYQSMNETAVISCSALKHSYREILIRNLKDTCFVWLNLTYEDSEQRLKSRADHYFKPELLKSQFDCLEDPTSGTLNCRVIKVEACDRLDNVIQFISEKLKDK